MAETEVIMPRMGESVNEATIIRWVKNEGDSIKADETLIEIATDKVDSEIPAPSDGILLKKLCKDGEVVAVGKAIAIISTIENGNLIVENSNRNSIMENSNRNSTVESGNNKVSNINSPASVANFHSPSSRFYSPLVKNIAKTQGITVNELETIPGSGKSGRVTKNDILAYIRDKELGVRDKANIESHSSNPLPPLTPYPLPLTTNDEIIEMDRIRKLIAEHMVMSKHTSPHVTSFVEADVTGIVMWREKIKHEFEKREGEKLTYTPVFIEAVVKAIKDYPMVNVSTDGVKIIRHRDINIGMAVALPTGNLIVPVIRNAGEMNLLGLTKKVNDLTFRARKNKLLPDDIQGGTFTITNVGTFGNIMGTPIINQPQAAILATGVIKKKPVVIESPLGDMIGIRQMMYLSLSYDHRIIDGFLGGSFLKRIADYLEKFEGN